MSAESDRLREALQAALAENDRLGRELDETNRGVLALYAELEDRAEDLRRASEAKSKFLSAVSHEIKTPLTSVLNLANLLHRRADGPLEPEQDRQVAMIQRAAQTLLDLVADLLDLSRIEAGKVVLRLGPVHVTEVVAALRGMSRAIATHPDVLLRFDEPDPALLLYTDEAKLSQILRNFLSNALKFTRRGEVALAIEAGADEITFRVRDTGIGIAPHDQARIFEEYEQVEGAMQHRARGSGLGLALSRKLSEMLSGRIGLESELGRGSVFSLTLPYRHPAARDGWEPRTLTLEQEPETGPADGAAGR